MPEEEVDPTDLAAILDQLEQQDLEMRQFEGEELDWDPEEDEAGVWEDGEYEEDEEDEEDWDHADGPWENDDVGGEEELP